jgi:hypothetical protein
MSNRQPTGSASDDGLVADSTPQWSTFSAEGATESVDLRGRTLPKYRGSAESGEPYEGDSGQ